MRVREKDMPVPVACSQTGPQLAQPQTIKYESGSEIIIIIERIGLCIMAQQS